MNADLRIAVVTGGAGKEGNPQMSAYSAAKASVIAFTKSMCTELALTPIRAARPSTSPEAARITDSLLA
ncbi:SDR family NAD(P)-dependent oxidoreductase [Paraburkholderia sp. A1RI-2L]|uniref:SDR family NAD(P)-dependent oxidoreductase n=1 Tax=Paraburkholderia sp. A1RI-2L TaxID=3028367 RepID=UPI003B9F75E4